MEWIVLALVLLFGLVFGATSSEVKTHFKMHQNRVTKNKITEQNYIDKFSK